MKPLQTTIPIFSTFSGILSAPLRFLTHKQRQAHRARRLPDQAGPELYDFFSRDGGTRARGTSSAAASVRWPSCRGCTPASSTRPPTSTPRCTTPSGSPWTCCRTAKGRQAGPPTPGPATTVSLRRSGPATPGRRPAARRADRRGLRLHRRRHREHHRRLGRPDQPGHGRAHRASWAAPRARTSCWTTRSCSRPADGREIFFEHTDGRIVLIYPMGDRVLVGHHRRRRRHGRGRRLHRRRDRLLLRPDRPRLPGHPGAPRTRSSTRFSGVRPLPRHDATQPGFVSRDYRIERRERRPAAGAVVLSLVGGKWTTFRALAEHLGNDVLAELGMARQGLDGEARHRRRRRLPGQPRTASSAGSRRTCAAAATRTGPRGLLTRYGTRAAEVIGLPRRRRPTGCCTPPANSACRELDFMAATRADRTPGRRAHPPHLARLPRAGHRRAAERSRARSWPVRWAGTRRARTAEIDHAQEVLERFHGVQVHSLVA